MNGSIGVFGANRPKVLTISKDHKESQLLVSLEGKVTQSFTGKALVAIAKPVRLLVFVASSLQLTLGLKLAKPEANHRQRLDPTFPSPCGF